MLLKDALRTRRQATALSCMKTLGRRGSPEVTPILARVLAVEKGSLGEAAAEARSGGLRPVARQAVAEIQTRLTGAEGASAGQLSLSSDRSGHVSLADDAAGRVSLPPSPGSTDADDGGEE